MSNLPKLSYVLLAYNREQYIRGAIETAFAQDYLGELEYIFSDDCSTDGTYDIMKECVENYKGNRKITLTQTPQNINLAGHTNHAVSFASGDYILRADDDDYSFTNRCTLLARAIAANPDCLVFIEPAPTVSELPTITEFFNRSNEEDRTYFTYDLEMLTKAKRTHPLWDAGVKSYARQLYTQYPPLPVEACNVDDESMALRALDKGSICLISGAPSILYLRNGANMCGSSEGDGSVRAMYEKEQKLVNFHTRAAQGIEALFEQFKEGQQTNPLLYQYINQLLLGYKNNRDRWNYSFFKRLSISQASLKKGSLASKIFTLARSLPLPLATRACSLLNKLKSI